MITGSLVGMASPPVNVPPFVHPLRRERPDVIATPPQVYVPGYFLSTALRTSLTADNGAQITVANAALLPAVYPFKLLINWGQATQEVVIALSSAGGNVLNVARGQDGTQQQTQAAGATVDHGVSAQEFNLMAQHLTMGPLAHGDPGIQYGASGVLPPGRFVGDEVKEADTTMRRIWNGSTWEIGLPTHKHLSASDGGSVTYATIYDVTAYGATGNGSTDDSTAIQTALTLASSTNPGSTLYFPAGTYLVNSELEIQGPVSIVAAPSAIILRGSSSMEYILKNFNPNYAPTGYTGRGNIFITGGIWDGNGVSITTSCTNIALAHADTIRIRDVTCRNVCDWHGIEINSSRNVVLEGCLVEGLNTITSGDQVDEAFQIDLARVSGDLPGMGAGAYDSTPCFDVTLIGCTARGYGSLGSHGKLVGSHDAAQGFPHNNIRVIGCYAENLSDYAIQVYNWNNVQIMGNTFVNCNGGVSVQVPSGITTDIERFEICNNQFIGSGTQNNGTAILPYVIQTVNNGSAVVRSVNIIGNEIKNWANGTAGIFINTTSDCVVSNNSIRGQTNAAVNGIVYNNSSGGVVIGNKLDLTGVGAAVGIQMTNASTDCVVSGNMLVGSAQLIQADSNRILVSGNMCRQSSTSANGIKLTTNCTDSAIFGNLVSLSGGTPTVAGIDVGGALQAIVEFNYIRGWGTTEGNAGPIHRGGTLTPNMSTSMLGQTNNYNVEV